MARKHLALGVFSIAMSVWACSSTSDDGANVKPPDDGASSSSSSSGNSSSSSGGSSSGEDPADTTPRIRIIGRVDKSDAAGPRIAWPGTRVIVRFRGSSLKVKINERSFEDGPSRYDVTVDNTKATETFVPNEGEETYELASGLDASAPHVVELYRRTESMVGITQLVGFEYPDGGELLAPPAWPNRRVEFIGDSETTGYGVDCSSAEEPFTGATENARESFAELTGAALKAETHNVSFSGKGVLRNVDDDQAVYADLYPRSIPLEPSAESWNFGTWTPDVIWIGLGTNDWSLGLSGDRSPPDAEAFKAKYRELVALVRTKNPNAKIVCAVEGSLSDDYPPDFNSYSNLKTILQAVVAESNDNNLFFHELPRASDADLTGCYGHPNAPYHQRASVDITAKIREVTGWK